MIKKFALGALLLGTPGMVEGAPILVEYTGHVYQVSNSVTGRFSLGAFVQGSFLYESSLPQPPPAFRNGSIHKSYFRAPVNGV
jgi:hypothetical protein